MDYESSMVPVLMGLSSFENQCFTMSSGESRRYRPLNAADAGTAGGGNEDECMPAAFLKNAS